MLAGCVPRASPGLYGDNYSVILVTTPANVKGGMPEKLKAGLKKYSPRLRKHTLHKIKRK